MIVYGRRRAAAPLLLAGAIAGVPGLVSADAVVSLSGPTGNAGAIDLYN